MFSFIKKYVETVAHGDIYGYVAMGLFGALFIWMLWFALRADKKYISELEELPFNDSSKKN
ncbi:MAG TPA: hypothetical protein VG603_07345 [Chitinophagales bacterium]|nr:hypothetical protein [Chitinophagales bacterium]